MSIKVVVEGFNTIAEANEFCNWYEGQGEQDASIWFECRKDEGKIPSRFMPSQSTKRVDDETIVMNLEMFE